MSYNIILGHFTKVFRECFFDILQKNRCQLHAINEQKLNFFISKFYSLKKGHGLLSYDGFD